MDTQPLKGPFRRIWDRTDNLSSPDKTQHIRQNPPFTDAVKCWEDQHFRDRWRSLLSVDDMVGDVVAALTAAEKIDNTYIFYSSGI